MLGYFCQACGLWDGVYIVTSIQNINLATDRGKAIHEVKTQRARDVFFGYLTDTFFPAKLGYEKARIMIEGPLEDLDIVAELESGDPKGETTAVTDSEHTTVSDEGPSSHDVDSASRGAHLGGFVNESHEDIPARMAKVPLPDLFGHHKGRAIVLPRPKDQKN